MKKLTEDQVRELKILRSNNRALARKIVNNDPSRIEAELKRVEVDIKKIRTSIGSTSISKHKNSTVDFVKKCIKQDEKLIATRRLTLQNFLKSEGTHWKYSTGEVVSRDQFLKKEREKIKELEARVHKMRTFCSKLEPLNKERERLLGNSQDNFLSNHDNKERKNALITINQAIDGILVDSASNIGASSSSLEPLHVRAARVILNNKGVYPKFCVFEN